jgi:hypothetical protein
MVGRVRPAASLPTRVYPFLFLSRLEQDIPVDLFLSVAEQLTEAHQ